MFRSRTRENLELRRSRLEEWRRIVPLRAERFHRRLNALAGDVDQLLERWWPRSGEVQRLEQRGERLRQVADRLPRLCEEADALAKKLANLRQPEGPLAPELEAWLAGRRRHWASQLASIGRHVERFNVLRQEESVVEELGEELRLAAESADSLHDAHLLLSRLPEEKTLPFRQQLPDLAQRLEDGPSDTWLVDLRRGLLPLKEADEQTLNPPRVIQDVFHLLSELRSWARHFGREQEVARMEERRRNLALDWAERDPSELEQLRQEVEEARLRFFDRAREERQQRLGRLEEEMEDFFAVCDRQDELEERLEELRTKHRSISKPQDYPGWLKSFEETHTFFKAIAENHQASLVQRLDELHTRLAAGLKQIRRQPLSDAVREAAAALEYEADRLKDLHRIEDVLQGLRRSQDLEQQLVETGHQARRENEELAGRKTELRARQEELRQAVANLQTDSLGAAIKTVDFDESLDALDRGDRTLEEARRDALRIEEQVASNEGRFIAECRAQIAVVGEEVEETLQTLRRAGRSVVRPAEKPLGEAPTPGEIATALAAGEAFRRALEGEVTRALTSLEGRRREQSEALDALSADELGPVDRADVELVREAFTQDLEADIPELRERLARLLDQIAQTDALFHQLRREEIDAQEHHRSLRQRFQTFREAHLGRYYPELTERLEGLIHGIPDPPHRGCDALAQLRRAEALLQNLDRCARRLAAMELSRDLATLQTLSRNGTDEQTREEAGALVAEVEALGGLRLPPVALRLRVRHAARSGS